MIPKMANLKFDVRGRLMEFVIVPPRIGSTENRAETDWKVVFELAGIDFANSTKPNLNGLRLFCR